MSHKKLFSLVIILVLIDQITKWFVRTSFQLGETKYWLFTYIQNTGAGFGIFKGNPELLGWVSIFAIGILLLIYITFEQHYRFPTALILAGTIGNAIDRFLLNYVVDFIYIKVWPAFNIADSAISIGGLLLVYHMFHERKLQRKAAVEKK